jgi:hypothetical protein
LVDGQDTRIYIVNGCQRGVFVDGVGTHTITMEFWPRSLTYGLLGTALAVSLLLGSVRPDW